MFSQNMCDDAYSCILRLGLEPGYGEVLMWLVE